MDTQQREHWLIRLLQRHPWIGTAWIFATVEIYLLFQTVPGVLDPKSRWGYLIFLGPMHLLIGWMAWVLIKMQRMTHRWDLRDRARREAAALAARPKVSLVKVQAPPELEDHEVGECPGPWFFPAGDEPTFWLDDVCGAHWQWRGQAWVQVD